MGQLAERNTFVGIMSSDGRAFVRVFLPGEQLRLFQLLPKVKFSSVMRALNMDGSLYLGERKLDMTETPESLGLQHGLDHAVDVSFVPKPPQFLFQQSLHHGEPTSGTYTPSLVFEEQSDRVLQRDETSVTSEASQPLSKDVQAVLRLLKDKHDRAKSPQGGSVDGRRPMSTPFERPLTTHTQQPHVQQASVKVAAPLNPATPYNPRSNELRASSIERSPQSNHTLNKVNATTVDRPGRRALPLERHQHDTAVPHTTWPQPVNHRVTQDSAPYTGGSHSMLEQSNVIEPSHAAATKEPPSPRLQGTRSRRQPRDDDSHAVQAHATSAVLDAAPPPTISSTERSESTTAEQHAHVSTECTSMHLLHANATQSVAAVAASTNHDAVEDFKRELHRLAAELQEEKQIRRQLERQVEWLTTLLPDDLVSYSAHHEHQRLMEDLRRDRMTKRRQPPTAGAVDTAA